MLAGTRRPARKDGRAMRGGGGFRSLFVIAVLALLTACGGNGGGGKSTSLDPNAPVLANIRATFGSPCSFPGGGGSTVVGTIETTVFEYTDADGDVRGGTLDIILTAPVGGALTFTAAIPSQGVTITGTTSGTITVVSCISFGGNASFTQRVTVTDGSGHVSNELELETPRPGGAPLLPRSEQAGLRGALEFRR
jgi:hypothetical protein